MKMILFAAHTKQVQIAEKDIDSKIESIKGASDNISVIANC